MPKKPAEKSHITPDRIHRFSDDDESLQYQEIIPGPNSVTTPATKPKKR